jgi:hypothetical protein
MVLAASAQAGQKVDIAFPFSTPAGEQPAGKYNVEFRQLAGGKYVELRNIETGAAVMFHPTNTTTNLRGAETPGFVFSCVQSGCQLKRIWENGVSGYDFRQRKLSPAEAERLAVVRIDTEVSE